MKQMKYVFIFFILFYLIICSCNSDQEYATLIAQNIVEYQEIKKQYNVVKDYYDSVENSNVLEVYYDSESSIVQEHLMFDQQFFLDYYDFHFFCKDSKSILFEYDYKNNTFAGSTFFIYSNSLIESQIVEDSVLFYYFVALPPKFSSYSLLLAWKSTLNHDTLFYKRNTQSNNLFVYDNLENNLNDTFCFINKLKPLGLDSKYTISDTLFFTLRNYKFKYLSPSMANVTY